MKKVYIMRGLPGAGKSTWIKNNTPGAVVCSADHFFEKSGTYQFDPTNLGKAHAECFAKFQKALERGAETIVVDNTNTTKWEFEKYQNLANLHGYDVELVKIFDGGLSDEDLANRNTHGVPLENIRRMRSRWQE